MVKQDEWEHIPLIRTQSRMVKRGGANRTGRPYSMAGQCAYASASLLMFQIHDLTRAVERSIIHTIIVTSIHWCSSKHKENILSRWHRVATVVTSFLMA